MDTTIRIQELARGWASAIITDMRAAGFEPGTANFDDEAEKRVFEFTRDLRADTPHVGTLALLTMREQIGRLTKTEAHA